MSVWVSRYMWCVLCVFFFFQAEEGIRDLVGSGGLGDGYKRQALAAPAFSQGKIEWRMVTTWPKNFPGLGVGAENLVKRINIMSAGRLTIADSTHFRRWAGRAMRSVIVDIARRRLAERRGGSVVLISVAPARATDALRQLAATGAESLLHITAADALPSPANGATTTPAADGRQETRHRSSIGIDRLGCHARFLVALQHGKHRLPCIYRPVNQEQCSGGAVQFDQRRDVGQEQRIVEAYDHATGAAKVAEDIFFDLSVAQRCARRQGGEQDDAQHAQQSQPGPLQPTRFEFRRDFVRGARLFGIARFGRIVLAQPRLDDAHDDEADDQGHHDGRGGLKEVVLSLITI